MKRLTHLYSPPAAAGCLAVLLLAGCGGNPPETAHRVTAGEAVVAAVRTNAAPADTETPPAEPEHYVLTDNTEIGWTGYKIVGQHSGSFLLFDGTVTLEDGTIESARAEIEIETASVLTDNSILTEVVKNDQFFDVNNYPTAGFEVTSVESAENGYWVTGNLTLRDVPRSIRFPAEIARTEDGLLTVVAEFTVNRRDWGIEYDGIGDNVLKDEILITLDAEAERVQGS